MNKKQLIEVVSNDTGVTKSDVERILNSIVETTKKTVVAGDTVQLIGFGTFKAVDKKATTARNPKTGETIKIKAKRVPKFVVGTAFKDAVASKKPKKK